MRITIKNYLNSPQENSMVDVQSTPLSNNIFRKDSYTIHNIRRNDGRL